MTTPLLFSFLILLTLAWGAFAFGAVYPWAYTPILWASAAIGAFGLIAPAARPRPPINWRLACGLALVAVAAIVQLVPLAPLTIASLSPATDRFLRQYDLAYALGTAPPAGLAAGAASYSHPLSIDPAGTWLGLACLAAFGLLLLGTARGLGRRSVRTLAGGLAVIGLLLAMIGIIQTGLWGGSGASGKIYGFWTPIFGTSPFGPFVNHNHFAGWMLLALPVTIGWFCALVARGMRGVKPAFRDRVVWFSSRAASQVILVGLAMLVMGLSLVLTLSRSGITCFSAALAISAWFVVRRQSVRSRRHAILAYLVVLATLSLGWAGLDAVVQRFAQAGADLSGRVAAWADTWRIAREFPWTGTGLNTYGTAMLLYQTADVSGHLMEAHNDYVQVAAEGGVLLGVPALVALGLLAREIRRRFRERQDDQTTYWVRVGATTGLVAIALQEIVEFSLQIPGIAALFAVVAAIAVHRPEPFRPADATRDVQAGARERSGRHA